MFKIYPIKKALKILFLLLVCNSYSQTLHHQMLSAQGGKSGSDSGILVNFTVGQQSVVGTRTGNITVQQGFQQSNWNKISWNIYKGSRNVCLVAFNANAQIACTTPSDKGWRLDRLTRV